MHVVFFFVPPLETERGDFEHIFFRLSFLLLLFYYILSAGWRMFYGSSAEAGGVPCVSWGRTVRRL